MELQHAPRKYRCEQCNRELKQWAWVWVDTENGFIICASCKSQPTKNELADGEIVIKGEKHGN